MRRARLPVVAISADSGEGLDALRAAVSSMLPDVAGLAEPPEPAGVVVHKLEAAGDGYTLEHVDGTYQVRGKRIERLVAQTNFDNEESAERFQRDLARLGIDVALRRAGVRPGDTVRIGRHGARVGAARGGRVTEAVQPPAPVVPARSGCWAGRSTRSTTATSRSRRTPASPSGWSGSCGSPPRRRRTSRAGP